MNRFDRYKQLLEPFISFESISTDPQHKDEMLKTADWLNQLFTNHGFTSEIWDRGAMNPVVYGHYQVSDPKADTVLIYGHYDVQPASTEDGWTSQPFRLVERSGRLYGRGVVDNKGQVLIHIAAVIELIETGRLTHNVIFMLEGDEETGGENMRPLLKAHRPKLTADHIIISDGDIPYRPTIEVGLRGCFNLSIKYITASNNLHSGIFGGGVPNAAQELSKLIAGFYDADQRITLPGFYDDVDAITTAQRAASKALYKGIDRLREISGIKQTLTNRDYDYVTATGLAPSLEVTGIESGYTGSGFANIIPGEARANLNIRTVSSQNSQQLAREMVRSIKQRTPSYVEVECEIDGVADAIKLSTDTPVITHTQELLKQAYGTEALFSYCGGTMPMVEDFKAVLGADSLLVSLGNDDCNMHGVDENFDIELIKKALEFSTLFFSRPIPK